MKKAIQTTHAINAPIDQVWNLIRTGENWENFLPILSGSRVEGNSRFCDLAGPDGHKDVLEEQFLSSDIEKTFTYQINKQQSFPAVNIVGIIRLIPNGEVTTMYWSVEMEVDNEDVFPKLKEDIEGIYAMGASKLEELALAKAA